MEQSQKSGLEEALVAEKLTEEKKKTLDAPDSSEKAIAEAEEKDPEKEDIANDVEKDLEEIKKMNIDKLNK